MESIATTLTQPNPEVQRDAFIERMLQSVSGLFDVFTIYIGDRLGFYQALAGHDWLTSTELVRIAGTNERYTREWLEQQTVANILEVADQTADALQRRYRLPAGHIEVLTHRESLNYLAPLAQLAVGAVHPIHDVLDAYRSGKGVPFANFGEDLREGQGNINRAAFLYELGQDWLPSLPDIDRRLRATPPARIADIGCGVGWSTIGMAQAYPNVRVDGFDMDEASIDDAWNHAHEYGLTDRVTFHVRDAAASKFSGRYDLVTAFECIHDMSDPVGVLDTMRSLAGESGSVIVMDERVGDTFTATGNDIEWMMYGWSVLHCLPVGMAEHPSTATGTVMRADILRDYAHQAGFREVEVLPIDNFFFRFYRLHQ